MMGTIGLVSVTAIFGFLGGVNYFNRDGNVSGMDAGRRAQRRPPRRRRSGAACGRWSPPSAWPGSWSARSASRWSSRSASSSCSPPSSSGWCSAGASGPAPTPRTTPAVRSRMLHPLEFPILAAVGLGVIVYAFSRIMLAVDQGRRWSRVRRARRAHAGWRLPVRRPSATPPSAPSWASPRSPRSPCSASVSPPRCRASARSRSTPPRQRRRRGVPRTGFRGRDRRGHASQAVSAKSSVIANVYLQADGVLVAYVNGFPDQAMTRSRSQPSATASAVMFHNDFDTVAPPHRAVRHLRDEAPRW